MISKGNLANEVATQIHAADDDHIGVRCRYRGFGWTLPPDLQVRTTPKASFSDSERTVAYRIYWSGPRPDDNSEPRLRFRFFGYRNTLGGRCRLQELKNYRPHAAK